MSRRLAAVCSLTVATLVGCSSEPEPRPLGSDQFYRRDDRGGALTPGPRVPEATAAQPKPGNVDPEANRVAVMEPSAEGLKFVTQQVKPVTPTTLPSESAATTEPAKPGTNYEIGQYISVGAIIAEVNGTPIYADDVVRSISPLLSARAKETDEGAFRSLAASEIGRQVDDMIRAEVAYAAADRNTSAEDKTMAERLTQQWRDRLKTENKGSMEEVRLKFREQGQTFDEAAKEQYRRNLVRVFYTKKLFPRIQVTANDLRRYYDQNLSTEFTQQDRMTFRLIKITPQALGSDAAAKKKIDELAARIARGEDFATVAGEINNDPALLRNKGLVGPVDRGAFRIDKIDTALWALNPGDVTPVIADGGAYYLARLDAKTVGRVEAFEENTVQTKMLEKLRSEQFSKMRRDLENQLRRDSVIAKNEPVYATTVSMAMQNYSAWRSK